jgi:hypothetical protein
MSEQANKSGNKLYYLFDDRNRLFLSSATLLLNSRIIPAIILVCSFFSRYFFLCGIFNSSDLCLTFGYPLILAFYVLSMCLFCIYVPHSPTSLYPLHSLSIGIMSLSRSGYREYKISATLQRYPFRHCFCSLLYLEFHYDFDRSPYNKKNLRWFCVNVSCTQRIFMW